MTEKYIEIGFVSLLNQIFESFQEEYKGQANFHITFAAQSESNCKDVLMGDLEAGADVFAFADDQLNTLVAAGALEPVENAGHIKEENLPGAVEAASVGEVLYAYPLDRRRTTAISSIMINSILMKKISKHLTVYYRLRKRMKKRSPWTGPPHGMYMPFLAILAWK